MPTKQQLEAENAALRELLAAASAYADLPKPASYTEPVYAYETERRLGEIAVWADGDMKWTDPGTRLLVLGDRAKHLREEAARPVRYEVKAAPEPVTVADVARSVPASVAS